jgi:hypothetical protein
MANASCAGSDGSVLDEGTALDEGTGAVDAVPILGSVIDAASTAVVAP